MGVLGICGGTWGNGGLDFCDGHKFSFVHLFNIKHVFSGAPAGVLGICGGQSGALPPPPPSRIYAPSTLPSIKTHR